MAAISDPTAAQRLARAIVSDIQLYNQDKVKQGIEEDTLFDTLSEEIQEGRALYEQRVAPEIVQNHNFFDLAIVDVLIKYSGKIKSKIW
ncbi:MAG: hypothetical protein AB1405_06390 [Bdellovibrionota bacterium]